MEERRIMAVRDGRRLPPRNSRGEFRRRRSRRDRGMMDYAGEDMRMRDYGDITRRGRYGDYGEDMGDYGEDMARGGRGRGRDYGYDYGDYGDDYGDYGETLSDKELEEWNKKLLGQLDERERQMFSKDAIMQKAKSMGKPMEGFGEKELYTATLAMYTDHKHSIGQNPDLAVKLGYDFLADKDVAVKGAEKLAVYYDCIVEGEE